MFKSLFFVGFVLSWIGATEVALGEYQNARRLFCTVAVTLEGKRTEFNYDSVVIPGNEFNYATRLQTFWRYLDIPTPVLAGPLVDTDVSFTVAMDKLGPNYGLSYIIVHLKDRKSFVKIPLTETVRGDQFKIEKTIVRKNKSIWDFRCDLWKMA